MYNPTIGRWMTEDPEGFEAADEDLFRYVHNDPTDLTDPSGLREVDDRRTEKTKKLEDSRADLESYSNGVLKKARGFAAFLVALPDAVGLDTKALRRDAIVWSVYAQLGKSPNRTDPLTPIEKHIETTWPKGDKDLKGAKQYTPKFEESWFSRTPANMQVPPAWRQALTRDRTLAAVININGVLMGTDKWGHFFQEGFWYYFNKLGPADRKKFGAFLEGDEQAFYGRVGLTKAEKDKANAAMLAKWKDPYDLLKPDLGFGLHSKPYFGMFGSGPTGVISYADNNANEAGFTFYTKLAANPDAFVFKVTDYPYKEFNEANEGGNPRNKAVGGVVITRP